MTAKEYFEGVQACIEKIDFLIEECEKERKRRYQLSAVDFSKEKVSGGKSIDISDKLIAFDTYFKHIQKELIFCYEVKNNCLERIKCMTFYDERDLSEEKQTLITWYFNNCSKKEKARKLGVKYSQNAYRKLNEALNVFGRCYERELKSMREVS